MQQIMVEMTFGPVFPTWMRLIYSRQIAEFFFDGYYSNSIVLKRGVRQGCCLSPLFFNVVIETLAMVICQCEKIRGIQTSTITHKVALYADRRRFLPPRSWTISPCFGRYTEWFCKGAELIRQNLLWWASILIKLSEIEFPEPDKLFGVKELNT